MTQEESIIGCLLGTAAGDALGLACEGMSKQRQQKMFPDVGRYHFLLGKGMVSDDTEHTCMVAQSLIVSAGKSDQFVKSLARRLRWWLLGLPAGVGFATLRSLLKLWLGISPERSGVFSAGNGPAMRSAIIGVCYGENSDHLRALIKASTRITHTDPKAELGALAVAVAAHIRSKHPQSQISPQEYIQALQPHCRDFGDTGTEFFELINKTVESAIKRQSTETFAGELGFIHGVTGYIYHTIPVVLHAWLSHQHDFRSAVTTVIRCGGDTDTTAAVVGAIVGAGVGKQGIPAEWLDNLWEWPRSVQWMEQLGHRLADVLLTNTPQKSLSLPIPGLLLRNLVFMLIVLIHGFRRIFPPYS